MKSLGRHVRLVSFDVFETALLRQIVEPSDVHYLTASRLGISDDHEIDAYVAARRLAEETARKKAALAGRTEIGIAEISSDLAELLPAELFTKRPIQIELELEQELATANPEILQFHKQARADGISVAFIADTCLPLGLVARMLRSAGYDWDYLFLSSQSGRTKQDGSLFTAIVEQTPFEQDQIVHVGHEDMPSAPASRSANFGLDYSKIALSLASDCQDLHPGRRTGVDSVALSLAASHRAKVADKLTPADVGYYSVGPMMAGFMGWVKWETQSRMPDHIVLAPRLHLGAELLELVAPSLAGRVRPSDAIWQSIGRDPALTFESFLSDNGVRPGDHIAVLDLGWDDGNVAYFQSQLPDSLDLSIAGFCLGLLDAPATNTTSWAFDADDNQQLAERIRSSSFISLLGSPRSQNALHQAQIRQLVDQIALGVMAFAEDIAPWINHGPTSASLCWPALRTVESPTYAEAQRLTDGWTTRDQAVSFAPRTATESSPLRSRLVRSLQIRPEAVGGQHLGAIWAQGSQILESGGTAHKAPAAHKRLALRTLRLGQRRNSQ